MENPFSVLEELLKRELDSGEFGRLRVLAKGFYQALGKVYHPDRGGDASLMAMFTSAMEDITRAPDEELEFYINELFDEASLAKSEHRARQDKEYALRGTTIRRLVGIASAVDQFAVTGNTAPRSFLCEKGDESFDQIVLDVRSPQETVAYLALRPVELTSIEHLVDRVYERGAWYDRTLTSSHKVIRKTPTVLSNPVSVSIIGRAPDKQPEKGFSVSATHAAIDVSYRPSGIAWQDPLNAWFLPLVSGNAGGGFVLVDATGKHVARTGALVASSHEN